MPNSGGMPAYQYRPHISGIPRLKTHSAIRARLFNDTYFRATEPGGPGNAISIGIVQVGKSPGTPQGTLFVTNHTTKTTQNLLVNGNSHVEFDFIDCSSLNFNETLTFTILSPLTLRAIHSISLQIAPNSPVTVEHRDLGLVNTRDLFYGPKGVSIQLNVGHSRLIPGDSFILRPRLQQYQLVWTDVVVKNPDGTEKTYSGWDIPNLRTRIKNNPSSWIQMLERSGNAPNTPPVIPPFDHQDEGYDEPVLATFSDTFLSGGDGLPATPDGQQTGPTRSIIHLNYSETDNGAMGLVNRIYEWSGTNYKQGEWIDLFS